MTRYISWISYACATPHDRCSVASLVALVAHDSHQPQVRDGVLRCPGCGGLAKRVTIRTEHTEALEAQAAALAQGDVT